MYEGNIDARYNEAKLEAFSFFALEGKLFLHLVEAVWNSH